ncbi:MAG: hypothetical protein J7M14_08300 [Planctomycetes bacterium]|nr:hypothetical protein [Planctomycetota bacterium]
MNTSRRKLTVGIATILCFLVAAAITAEARATEKRRLPFTRLFDTSSVSDVPLPGEIPARPERLTEVAYGDTTHAFAGDAVLLNNKLAIVLRKKAAGAEVYSLSGSTAKLRTTLAAVEGGELTSLRIAKNTRAAVTLEATFTTAAGQSARVSFRLTTGAKMLEIRPGSGAAQLLVRDEARCLVVPELFADDVVVDGIAPGKTVEGLPAENFFLALLADGGAMAMYVWESNEQNVDVIFSGEGDKRHIEACRVQCLPGKRIWVALIEKPGIWHCRTIGGRNVSAGIDPDWRRPFDAKWRVDFVGAAGTARSLPLDEASTWAGKARAMVIYPIDRSRSTPLGVKCPIGIMRSAVGMGACEYMLAIEGLARPGEPASDQVIKWIERQFTAGRHQQKAAEIRSRLAGISKQMKRPWAGVEKYRRLGKNLRELSRPYLGSEQAGRTARKILDILDEMDRNLAGIGASARSADYIDERIGAIADLLSKDQALDACRKLLGEIHAAGKHQNAALSRARMAMRRIKQLCRRPAKQNALASQALPIVARMLKRK